MFRAGSLKRTPALHGPNCGQAMTALLQSQRTAHMAQHTTELTSHAVHQEVALVVDSCGSAGPALVDNLIATHVTLGGPVPEAPRQGRARQRYAATGERLVAGCIPVRVNGDGMHNVEILLISSRQGKGYCFPKGGWEDDETVEIAAKRETMEEAGVRGELESGKPGAHQKSIHQGRCIAHMYVMYVAEMLEVWPESAERQRIWVPLVEAVQRCRHEWMREALLTWAQRKGWSIPVAEIMASGLAVAQQAQLAQHAIAPAGHGLQQQREQEQVMAGVSGPPLSSVQVGVTRVQAASSPLLAQSPTFTDAVRASVTFASNNSVSTDVSETSDYVETAPSTMR